MWYFTWILGTGFAVFFAVAFGLLADIREEKNQNKNQ